MLKQGYTCKYTAILFAVVRLYFPLRGIILSVRIYRPYVLHFSLTQLLKKIFTFSRHVLGHHWPHYLKTVGGAYTVQVVVEPNMTCCKHFQSLPHDSLTQKNYT